MMLEGTYTKVKVLDPYLDWGMYQHGGKHR